MIVLVDTDVNSLPPPPSTFYDPIQKEKLMFYLACDRL